MRRPTRGVPPSMGTTQVAQAQGGASRGRRVWVRALMRMRRQRALRNRCLAARARANAQVG